MRILAAIVASVAGILCAAPTASAAGGLLGDLTAGTETSSGSDAPLSQVTQVVETTAQVAEPVTTAGASTVGNVTTGAPAVDSVTQTVKPVTEATAPVVEGVAETAAPLTKPVSNAVAPVTDRVAHVTEPIVETVAPVVAAAEPVIEPVVKTVAPVLHATQPVVDAAAPALDPLRPVLDDAAATLENGLGKPSQPTASQISSPSSSHVNASAPDGASSPGSGDAVPVVPSAPGWTTSPDSTARTAADELRPPVFVHPFADVPFESRRAALAPPLLLFYPPAMTAPNGSRLGGAALQPSSDARSTSAPRLPSLPAPNVPWGALGAGLGGSGGSSSALFAALAAAILLVLPRLGRRLPSALAPRPRPGFRPLLERPG